MAVGSSIGGLRFPRFSAVGAGFGSNVGIGLGLGASSGGLDRFSGDNDDEVDECLVVTGKRKKTGKSNYKPIPWIHVPEPSTTTSDKLDELAQAEGKCRSYLNSGRAAQADCDWINTQAMLIAARSPMYTANQAVGVARAQALATGRDPWGCENAELWNQKVLDEGCVKGYQQQFLNE